MESQQSTPLSQRASSSCSFSKHRASGVDRVLSVELDGCIQSVEVEGFLAFAGLTIWETPEWGEMTSELNADNDQKVLKQAWLSASSENLQYEPFCKWVDALMTLIKRCKEPPRREISFLPLGVKYVPSAAGYVGGDQVPGSGSKFKPDAVCVPKKVTTFGEWWQVLIPLKFKKGDKAQPSTEAINPSSTSSSQSIDVPREAQLSRDHSISKLSEDSASGDGPLTKKAKRVPSMTYRIKSGTTSTIPQPDPSTPPPYCATDDDVQLARCAMETLAAVGDRTHVFGLAVSRPKVTLWYFDRCGAIRSPELNVNQPEDFSAFIKFLSAIAYMKDDALGFNPLFADPIRAKSGTRPDLCQMSVDIPSRLNWSLKLLEVLARRTGLVGRASLVYRGVLQRWEGNPGTEDDVVIKSSWQHRTRKREWEILEELHSDPQARDYIVAWYHGWEQNVTGSAQRAKFGQPTPSTFHDRALRHTIVEYLNPIKKLSKPFHVPHIGWSVLQAIRFLNDKDWFHCDISIGNMGFVILPSCKGVVVKLHDFDLSRRHNSTSEAPHWTGTLPFMSIPLLENHKSEYKIGFEVEALIWTLLWIVRVCTDEKGVHTTLEDHPLDTWFSNRYSLEVLASNKNSYLAGAQFTNTFYESLESEMASLAEEWWNMRIIQTRERKKTHNKLLISDQVYGMNGFTTIQTWMMNSERRWNVPRKPCLCEDKVHCAGE